MSIAPPVAPVRPVACVRPTRLMVPAVRMTSRTTDLLFLWDIPLTCPLTGPSPRLVSVEFKISSPLVAPARSARLTTFFIGLSMSHGSSRNPRLGRRDQPELVDLPRREVVPRARRWFTSPLVVGRFFPTPPGDT